MTDNKAQFSVALVPWEQAKRPLSTIRRLVFIEEQNVPEALEWDGLDEASIHVLARSAQAQAVGCARLSPEGQIGRMAVIPEARHQGIATAMLETILAAAAKQGFKSVYLHAQTHAVSFYEQRGFQTEGDEFMDAGIPHRQMRPRASLANN